MDKGSSSSAWAACLAASLAAALDPIRLVPGLEACLAGPELWVRGGGSGESGHTGIDQVPWFHRYEVRDKGLLFEGGSALPSGRLPAGPWQPLREVLVPVAPVASYPGSLTGRALLEMHRSAREQTAALLAAPVRLWHDHAVAASAIRLARWEFVLNEDRGLALIRGAPLPSLPGTRFWVAEQLAFPAGYQPVPRLSPRTMARLLGLLPDELALFDEDGTFARVKEGQWRHADRSVVRMNCGPRAQRG